MKQNKFKELLVGLKNKLIKKEEAMELEVDNLQGIGKRHQQEDSFYMSDCNDENLVKEKGFLAVVADGMGGMLNGAQTSVAVTQAAREYFEKYLSLKNSAKEELIEMLRLMDARVKQLQLEQNVYESGSTLTAVWIHDYMMHFLTVGDSRIYLLRKGKLYQINRDHNLRSKLIEKVIKEEMERELYQDMMGKSGLTSYIGKEEIDLIDISVRPFLLEKDDVILLASDGIFGTLGEEELTTLLEKDFDNAAQNIKIAIERVDKKKQDNYTAIIVKCMNGEGDN